MVEGKSDAESRVAPVVALVADLFFGARIRGTAEQVGVPVTIVRGAGELLRAVQGTLPRMIVVQLDLRTGDFAAAIRQIKADPALARIPIVGFASHVDQKSIALAREAGADRVIARSAFVKELANMLAPGG